MTRATLLYRIASGVLVLFAAGHTFGFLRFKPSSPEALAVRESMDSVRFQVGRSTFSYGGFYKGFGLYITVYLLFAAFLSWRLGALADADPGVIVALGWAFFAVQVVSLVLSWIYFSAPPAILSALLAICLGWAALLTQRAAT
jgi:hypothetical protein